MAKAADATKAAIDRKRQESKASARRIEVDATNEEPLSTDDLSTAKLFEATVVMDTIKYWAQGSVAAVLQLVMMLISSFGLESQVAAELGAELDQRNLYIVNRANAALQILKQCRTKEQRQHYRIVQTALAPEKVEHRDNQGMGTRVAAALGVSRQGAPFCDHDSVDVRAEIDAAAAVMDRPVVVGDSVICRHGTGTLTSCAGPDDPCAVEIKIGDVVHTSKFKHLVGKKKGRHGKKTGSGYMKGSGRVRRCPISFSHKMRAERKDRVSDSIQDKVCIYQFYFVRIIMYVHAYVLCDLAGLPVSVCC